jgi:hypothetical protein
VNGPVSSSSPYWVVLWRTRAARRGPEYTITLPIAALPTGAFHPSRSAHRRWAAVA